MKLRSEHAGQNIAANKPAQARQKKNAGLSGNIPAQIAGRESLQAWELRLERVLRERLDSEATEQVMHHRITDEDDAFQKQLLFRT